MRLRERIGVNPWWRRQLEGLTRSCRLGWENLGRSECNGYDGSRNWSGFRTGNRFFRAAVKSGYLSPHLARTSQVCSDPPWNRQYNRNGRCWAVAYGAFSTSSRVWSRCNPVYRQHLRGNAWRRCRHPGNHDESIRLCLVQSERGWQKLRCLLVMWDSATVAANCISACWYWSSTECPCSMASFTASYLNSFAYFPFGNLASNLWMHFFNLLHLLLV